MSVAELVALDPICLPVTRVQDAVRVTFVSKSAVYISDQEHPHIKVAVTRETAAKVRELKLLSKVKLTKF